MEKEREGKRPKTYESICGRDSALFSLPFLARSLYAAAAALTFLILLSREVPNRGEKVTGKVDSRLEGKKKGGCHPREIKERASDGDGARSN